jgi:hypothetical protein
MALVTVFDHKGEPFEVRPHHSKHLVSLGWSIEAPTIDVPPVAAPEIAEVQPIAEVAEPDRD